MVLLYVTFEQFVAEHGARLRAGLVGAYGPDAGLDAAAEALAYGWEHWERLAEMDNPAGYLYRVGQSSARSARRRPPMLPRVEPPASVDFEPGLLPALEELSETQRVAVVMVHGYGWGQTETAELLGVSPSTVRTHLARGLARLQELLEVHERVD